MPTQLTEIEARILGSLVEKGLTTPDQYPLSVNALTNACNQKTSREPVMNLEQDLVGKSLYPLIQKGLVEQKFDLNSRVPKFKHHIEKLLNGDNAKEIGAICVLLLRGPQTPGEIKTRSERLCMFTSTSEVEALLQEMSARPDPFVVRLARQPGQKETRYQHLFCGAAGEKAGPPLGGPAAEESTPASAPKPIPAGVTTGAPESDRVTALEKRVEVLEKRLAAVESQLRKPDPAASN